MQRPRPGISRIMWIHNVRVLLPDTELANGALLIQDGAIARVVDGPLPYDARGPRLDGRGMLLMPGLIDMHGDMIEREIEPRPNARMPYAVAIHELDKRLAAAGITTAFPAVSFSVISIASNMLRRDETAREVVDAISAERDACNVDWRVHARFEVTNENATPILHRLISEGKVHLISLNDHTPGQGQYRDIEKYLKEMTRWAGISSVYGASRIDADAVREAQQRPIAWDVIQTLTELAVARQLPVASHDDDTREKIALMQSMGVTISEFPVTMEAAAAARERGMHVAMGAPNALRGKSNTGNLSAREAVAAGLVDMLASDYHPGAMLQAMFVLAREGGLPLHSAARLVTHNPATACALDDRGALIAGRQADLAIIDPSGSVPRVRMTLRAGRMIYGDGTFEAQPDGVAAGQIGVFA